MRICSVNGCKEKHDAKGFCPKHYMTWRRHGDPLASQRLYGLEICSVKGCKEKHEAKGFCGKHYMSWKRYGDPLSAVEYGSLEWRRRISEATKGRKGLVGKKNWNYGRKGKLSPKFGVKLSKETKKLMSDIAKAAPHTWKKGQKSWNTGLTKESHPSVKRTSEKMKGNKIRIGYKTPEKTKIKISNTLKTKWKTEKHYMIGWVPSEETRRKIGLKHKGKTVSEDAKKKIRKARLQQVFPPKDTKPEKALQKMLKDIGIKFQKHKPIRGQPDIFIKPNICVFMDGDYWHANPKNFVYKGKLYTGYKKNDHIIGKIYAKDKWANDKKITNELRKNGFRVLRFWQSQFETDPEKCIQKIIKAMK